MFLFRRKRIFIRSTLVFTFVTYVFLLTWLGLLLSTIFSQHPSRLKKEQSIIHIGTVVCGGSAYLNSSAQLPSESEAEVLTLIKSIYISAKSYHVKQSIVISIFTDTYNLQSRIKTAVGEYDIVANGQVNVEVNYYSVYTFLPEGYEKVFVDGNVGDLRSNPCGHIRLFFPDSLPLDIQHILYLDTDVIVTGNISRIWEKMVETVTDESEESNHTEILAAMALNTEPHDNRHMGLYKRLFGNIPHVPPRGVNSGVMFMNLEAMRRFNWTDRVMRIYFENRAAQEHDQSLVNILFHNNPDRLKLLTCQYNFMHVHCEITLNCAAAVQDADGIQILHGAGGRFSGSLEKAHNLIYQNYKQFDLREYNDIEKHLYKPLKRLNSVSVNRSPNLMYARRWDNCRESIGKLLYVTLEL